MNNYTSIFDRSIEGTLLCICGNRGREFIHVNNGILRGICSDLCFAKWIRLQKEFDIEYSNIDSLCISEMELMNDNLAEPSDSSILDTEIKTEPLIGPDEVTHKGRHITLTGEAWLRRKVVIDNMTDEELRSELQSMKEAVHEAEVILDYRRIIKNNLENQLELRTTKYSRLQLLRMTAEAREKAINSGQLSNGQSTTPKQIRSIPASEGNDLKSAMSSLSKLGLSKEKLILLIQKLAQNKENK